MSDVKEMPAYEVNLSIVPGAGETISGDELEATAEAVLEAVRSDAAFVALGAVVSLDLTRSSVDLYCHVCGDNPDEIHHKVARVLDVMLNAANRFEYSSSATQRGDLVPA